MSLFFSALPAAPLRVGIDLEGQPMSSVDAKGVPRGFSVDIVSAISREMNFEVTFVAKPWSEMMEDFKAGRTDALANITYTPDRNKFIDFTDPHLVMQGAIFVRKGDHSINSPVDLRNRRVALKLNSAPHVYLEAHGWAQNLVPSANLRDSLRAIAEGRADAALDARIIGNKDIRDEHLTGIVDSEVELVDFAQRLHVGLHPGDNTRVALFNEGLARLRTNGEYDRIYERWIGPLEPGHLRLRDVQPYLPLMAVFVVAIIVAFVWQRRVLSKVAQQATALRQSITDLKRAEEEKEKLQRKMLEAQKLESLGVLAGGIAHDFNNLLTVVLANASLARSDLNDPLELDEQLAQIETAARRSADLCRQMLAYAGRGSFVAERLDLGRLVQATTRLLQVSISKKAHLVLNLAPDLPTVEADASQLQQVIMNLVINASEAMGENNGEIRLTTRKTKFAATPGEVVHSFDLTDEECVCLEVADTGQGMPATTLARIFDPFFTTKFTGRGLGLAAVLGIVRSCKGALTVRSAPGTGTTFRLFLPAAQGPANAIITAAPFVQTKETAPSFVGTILIADDEPVVLSTTSALLKREGYDTVLAADGQQALDFFRADPDGFSAVLLDLTMPGLNGGEVLQEIRRMRPATRVIVMSGFSEQDVLKRLEGLHPAAILHKPFAIQALISRLRDP